MLNLGKNIPSTVEHNVREMFPNDDQIYDPEGALPTGNWQLSSASVSVKMKVSHTVMFDSVTPWTVTRQAPLSMAFSRQEY